ncbi:MAG TPA: amidohydrolase family protein [Rhizomicrobium sp.]
MTTTVFENASVFDGHSAALLEHHHVAVEDGFIREVSATAIKLTADVRLDLRGRTLMPGLIDCHVHLMLTDVNIGRTVKRPKSYLSAFAAAALGKSLDRGFTTLRDAGGADIGLAMAVADGVIPGARLYHSGRILSQTGGHADFRAPDDFGCGCGALHHDDGFSVLVDSPDAVRQAVREELRRGAHQIKIVASGGVASLSDPLERMQFTDAEIASAVEECARHGAYVMAHCHPATAIRRCAELGVRSIEHATMIDAETAALLAARSTYAVPTLAVCFAMMETGKALGFPAVSLAKMETVFPFVIRGLEHMRDAGVKMGLGTDLFGAQQDRQCTEFALRSRVLKPVEILRSATSIGAEILGLDGKLGCIAPGAHADILVVDGNPLKDIGLLAQDGRALGIIMKAGAFHKNAL